MRVTIDADRLEAHAASLLRALGAPAETAEHVATSLVDADRKGHTSHGVLRISTYDQMIADGVLVPDAEPEVTTTDGPTAVVDGRGAFGHVVGRTAVETLAERSAQHELCFLSFVYTSGSRVQ